MHYALPPRKSAGTPYPHAQHNTFRWPRWMGRGRGSVPPLVAYITGGLVTLILLVSLLRRSDSKDVVPAGTPHCVIVTAFDESFRGRYERTIIENRETYARMHDYGLFLPNKTDYDLSDPPSPPSWARIPAMRHAMASFPHTEYFLYLDQHALIMRPDLPIESHIANPTRLSEIMLIDHPVVPPSSVIRTYKYLQPEDIDAVFTQDAEGVSSSCFLLRRGEWAKYFLDAWFDPLYRSYNFQKAERHALEHLVQWHGTVLVKMALVPQRVLNAYTSIQGEGMYKDGDFVANLHGCDLPGSGRDCEREAEPLVERLMALKLDR